MRISEIVYATKSRSEANNTTKLEAQTSPMTIIERIAIRSAGRGFKNLMLGFVLGLLFWAAVLAFFYWLGTLNLTP